LELFVVRHGETDFNRQRIVQGRGVDSELNQTGLEQARRFFHAYRDRGFAHVYVSSLRRTRQTAAPFIDAGHAWSAHPELDEIDWGDQEGRKPSEAMKRRYRHIMDKWAEGQLELALPGGESPAEVAARVDRFLEAEVWRRLGESRLSGEGHKRLLFCHGRTMRVLLCRLLDKPLTAMDDFSHGNTALYHLAWDGGGFSVLSANNRKHLNPSGPVQESTPDPKTDSKTNHEQR
jgi:probable phosphoglycerate mutase